MMCDLLLGSVRQTLKQIMHGVIPPVACTDWLPGVSETKSLSIIDTNRARRDQLLVGMNGFGSVEDGFLPLSSGSNGRNAEES